MSKETESPLKGFIAAEMHYSLQQWHDEHPNHTLGGCISSSDKMVPIHEGVIRAIQNWCGNCTDPGNGPDMFYNKRSMWKALNMIYTLLEELQEGPQRYEANWGGETWVIDLPQIKSIKNGGDGKP